MTSKPSTDQRLAEQRTAGSGSRADEIASVWPHCNLLDGWEKTQGFAAGNRVNRRFALLKGDVLNCCGKMPGLRRDGLPGSFNLPKQLRMSPSPIELSRIILSIPIMVFKNLQAPARRDGNSYPRQATATSNWLSCQGWQVHGMDLVPSNASRMDHFKSSGRVPHERRYLHTLRPYILILVI